MAGEAPKLDGQLKDVYALLRTPEFAAYNKSGVLVLGNRGDAATPYENSVRVAKDLVNGHLVSNDGEGHTSFGRSRCVDDAVTAYLIDLEVPATDPDCR